MLKSKEGKEIKLLMKCLFYEQFSKVYPLKSLIFFSSKIAKFFSYQKLLNFLSPPNYIVIFTFDFFVLLLKYKGYSLKKLE